MKLDSHICYLASVTVYDAMTLTKFMELELTMSLLRFNLSGSEIRHTKSQVIAVTWRNSRSGCDHLQISKKIPTRLAAA